MWGTILLAFNSAWVFLKPIILALLSEVTTELLEDALAIVKQVSTEDMTSDQKREFVLKQLKETYTELSDNTLNTVLELVVAKFKSE